MAINHIKPRFDQVEGIPICFKGDAAMKLTVNGEGFQASYEADNDPSIFFTLARCFYERTQGVNFFDGLEDSSLYTESIKEPYSLTGQKQFKPFQNILAQDIEKSSLTVYFELPWCDPDALNEVMTAQESPLKFVWEALNETLSN